ncbi:MAG TPA: Wzz/FepE/Etk N-terminal domain-containing protein [Stellaceae bacterium]|nr:Wzz/FepE/Etk N-terminal domain-containing protein [Stellaceae bacterium]
MAFVEVPTRPSRRRVLVFTVAFLVAAAASLAYVYTRPPEYRANARLQITPAATPELPAMPETDPPTIRTQSDDAAKQAQSSSFLTEVQVLTSRPLLAQVVNQLRTRGELPNLGSDAVAGVQKLLTAEPIEGTEVVNLSAQGTDAPFLARLVNGVMDTYRQHVATIYAANAASATSGMIDEEKTLAIDVAAKQAILEDYRKRYDIVSLERNENETLAKVNGLNAALIDANTKLTTATSNLEAARRASAEGGGPATAKDDPTLADLEQRASVLREQQQDMQRKFTPDYLALDSNAVELNARLANLDKQIAERRVTSRQATLAAAQDAYAGAKASVDQLGQEIAAAQHDAQDFSTHLGAYKSMQLDLDHVEALHRDVLDRLTQLQASTRERAPQVDILEAAATPNQPFWPDYQRDMAASLAGSVVFALFAALFGEFLVGPAPSPGLTVRHSWIPSSLVSAQPEPVTPALAAASRPLELPAPGPPLRELADPELSALVGASGDQRLACAGLLMGLGADELVSLRWDVIDLARNIIRVAGTSPRTFRLEEPLRGLIASRPKAAATLLHDGNREPLRVDEVARGVLYAAYDAGLDRPHEITPAVLRHTYLCYLLRQGMRMSDLARIAGNMPQADLAVYAQIAGGGVRRSFEQVDRVLPALRQMGSL